MQTYLYIHYFAGVPGYVGVGTKARPFNFALRNWKWKARARVDGLPTVDVLCSYQSRGDACAAEVALIETLRSQGFDLASLTAGGDSGGPLEESVRRKMSATHRARVRTDEEVRQASERSRAAWADPERRARMTAAIRAAQTPERRARRAHLSAEMMADPERRAHLARVLGEHWGDPERRAHESARKRELMADPKRRAQCAEAAKQQHADPAFRARYLAGRATPVQCVETGQVFETVSAAADHVGESIGKLRAHLLDGRSDFGGSHWVYVKK